GSQARKVLAEWFHFYNWHRPHSTFDGQRPMDIYRAERPEGGGHAPLPLLALNAA
ncbi:hypothetical protein DPQ33_18350, partial [Oceanidesulfovibrio indonesiensis]